MPAGAKCMPAGAKGTPSGAAEYHCWSREVPLSIALRAEYICWYTGYHAGAQGPKGWSTKCCRLEQRGPDICYNPTKNNDIEQHSPFFKLNCPKIHITKGLLGPNASFDTLIFFDFSFYLILMPHFPCKYLKVLKDSHDFKFLSKNSGLMPQNKSCDHPYLASILNVEQLFRTLKMICEQKEQCFSLLGVLYLYFEKFSNHFTHSST